MRVPRDQSSGGEGAAVHHLPQVRFFFQSFGTTSVVALNDEKIRLPSRALSSREQSFQEFQRGAGFPGVLGVLDCVQVVRPLQADGCFWTRVTSFCLRVQVAIKAPNSEDSSYVNKKGFHSVACQLVCDARGLLLSAETQWPGGLEDTVVLERSAVYKQLQDIKEGWLLGETCGPCW